MLYVICYMFIHRRREVGDVRRGVEVLVKHNIRILNIIHILHNIYVCIYIYIYTFYLFIIMIICCGEVQPDGVAAMLRAVGAKPGICI